MADHSSRESSQLQEHIPGATEVSTTSSRKVRSQRPRYTGRACQECKRRKVKCNGESPCHHCDRYDVPCLYPAKDKTDQNRRFSDMDLMKQKLEILQQQIALLINRDSVSEHLAKDQAPLSGLVPSPHSISEFRVSSISPGAQFSTGRSPQQPENLPHEGSITSRSPHRTGAGSLLAVDTRDDVSVSQSNGSVKPSSTAPGRLAVACHPLLSISQVEAMRLIDIYEDECGSVYPLIDVGDLRHFAARFYDDVIASHRPATWRTFQLGQLSKKSFHTLEIVLAIGLVVEGRGSTPLSSALMDELEAEIDHRPSGTSADLTFTEILTLMSLYQFYRDEETLAWRTIGLAVRLALEVGLHLRDPPFATLQITQERERANRVFWCIYCLDRRWSFGTGLPFGIQEDDIDPNLPEPNDSHPYLLTSMIAYSRIGSKIVKTSSGADHLQQLGRRETAAFLTYQVQQWYASLDPELRIDSEHNLVLEGLSPSRNRLRILNYLRNNQLRMLIHRKSLFATASILADLKAAKEAVGYAKNTITFLDKLRQSSDIYSSHAVCFNYFLYSALTVILLAAYHAKAQFHEDCREEFHIALTMIEGFAAKSSVARKLWKIIKHLKVIGPESGILPYMEAQQDSLRQERNPDIEANQHAGFGSQSFGENLAHSTQSSTKAHEMNGLRGSMGYGEANFNPCDYAVDGSLLSSELSDLFQSIDPTRFEPMDSQLLDQRTFQSSPFQMAPKFLSTYFD